MNNLVLWVRTLGPLVLMSFVGIVVLLFVKIRGSIKRARAERDRLEKAREEKRKALADLPNLDTSHMLPMVVHDLTSGELVGYRPLACTFGYLGYHLLVVDKYGTPFYCLMTEYNMLALWEAGFLLAGYEPVLCEGGPGVVIDGERIPVYPKFLSRINTSHGVWEEWGQRYQEFLRNDSRNYMRNYERYYDDGVLRPEPVRIVA